MKSLFASIAPKTRGLVESWCAAGEISAGLSAFAKARFGNAKLAILFVLLAALALMAALGARADRQIINQVSIDGAYWPAAEAELALARTLANLSELGLEPKPARLASARTDLGDLEGLLPALGADSRISALRAEIGAAAPLLASLEAGDADAARELRLRFARHVEGLAAVSSDARERDARSRAEIAEMLRASGLKGALIVAATLLACAIIVVFAQADRAKQARIAAVADEDARRLERANASNSRFLTTMSHELRTPLNGVLGSIALARANRDQAEASKMLDKAEWSAKRLLGMVTDAFEFAKEDAERPAPRCRAFRLDEAATLVRDRLLRDAAVNGVDAAVHVSGDGATTIMGDPLQFGDAVARFGSHIADSVGIEKISVEIAYRDGGLRAVIRVVHGASAGWLLPSEPFVGGAGGGERFDAEALGPALARKRIADMKGVVEVGRISAGVSSVTVTVPMTEARPKPLVRVEVESGTMRHICEIALKKIGAVVVEAKERADQVDAIIVEPRFDCDDQDERSATARRRSNPGASIIAAGAPTRPELYDAIVKLPADTERLSAFFRRPP